MIISMYFEFSILIHRLPSDVFAFLRDKDPFPQEKGSPVLILEKTTVGPAGVGTCYREVVQMLPFVKGEILSEITRYEPCQFIEEDFEGASMKGHLAYQFLPEGGGTMLIQRETLSALGLLKPLELVIERMLSRKLQERLEEIKDVLESGWSVTDQG